MILLLFLGAMFSSAVITGLVRRYALAREVVDQPSERGLHDRTVPRGGGAAVVLVVSLSMVGLVFTGTIDKVTGFLWTSCGLGFGVLGWVDDHIGLSAAVRFACQLALGAVFCVPLLLSAAPFIFSSSAVEVATLAPLAVVIMVWLVNLYNFMDGADGFAALEALVVAGAGGAIVGATGAGISVPIAALVAGSSAGFLLWNWEPARIFMGDVGSYFLGFQFAALILHSAITGTGAWVWLILLAPFVTDSSLTLLRRVINREKWWQAHRTHAYQRLILGGWSHSRVSIALLVMTMLVPVPAAVFAARFPAMAAGATATTYVIAAIIWLAIIRKKGQPA